MLPDFPPSRRSTAIGIAGATGGLGAVAGPALGSVLIEAFSWRAIFLINVPLCLLVLVVGPRFLRESRDPAASGRIDLLGVAIGTSAVALVMFAIVQSESWGVADWRGVALFVIGLALLPVLVRRSRSHPEPLLDLGLFRFQSFRASNVGIVLYGFAFPAGFLVNSLVLQDLWGQSIRTTGLALVPAPFIAALWSPVSGRFADRYGHRWVLGAGCSLCAVGYGLFALLLDETPAVFSGFVPLSLVAGVGVGLTVATWSSANIADIPASKFGVAGATFNTARQAAYALGVSVAITLIATGSGDSGEKAAGYQWAWWWIAGCYVLAAVAIMTLFPAGSSFDRQGEDAIDSADQAAPTEV